MSSSGTWQERRVFWRELCAEFGASGSGVTQKAFAAERGVNVKRFRKWLRRFRVEEGGTGVPEQSLARFVEIELPVVSLVRVCVGGVQVEFDVIPPPAWVAELATRLGSGTC